MVRTHANFVLTFFVLVAAGCASDPKDADPVGSGHGQCAQRGGTYRSSYTTRSGNCGDIPEEIHDGPQPPAGPQPGCTGRGIAYTADNCEVSFDTMCPSDGFEKGGSLRENGTSKWNVGATYGTATEQFVVFSPNGQVRCSGTYDVVITRQ